MERGESGDSEGVVESKKALRQTGRLDSVAPEGGWHGRGGRQCCHSGWRVGWPRHTENIHSSWHTENIHSSVSDDEDVEEREGTDRLVDSAALEVSLSDDEGVEEREGTDRLVDSAALEVDGLGGGVDSVATVDEDWDGPGRVAEVDGEGLAVTDVDGLVGLKKLDMVVCLAIFFLEM
ncbi:hypothetical protein Pcinc_035740 [Petrolisthes cinctipes]|uniref:Uncharacterized protein n=1 Tax=Petrolisthes cinctipes TaxID=88211 RepID=A0AAE1EMN6_PETCI|nr:hypothetical protein Pcinc_035740 [Petrolisthes cinctipes]